MTGSDNAHGATARSALTKASWRLLPLLGLAYLIAYIDRANISFAAKQMNADLGFSATVYGLGAGMFFLSYALFEIPSNVLMLRFGPRIWLARIMVTWGLLSAAMMFVRSENSFYVLRFLIGLAEAGFFPAVIFYLTQWFPHDRRGSAISRFYLFGPLGVAVLGIVSGWLLSLHGTGGLRGWQWLFLVQGLPAVAVGLIILKILPDRPETARWLTAPERAWYSEAMAKDAARVREPESHDVWTALRNPMVRHLAAQGFLIIAAFYAFNLSAPIILGEKTGMDVTHVGYLTSIGGLLGALSMAISGWIADLRKERFTVMYCALVIEAAGLLTVALAPSAAVAITGYLLFSIGTWSLTLAGVMLWSDILHVRSLAVSTAAINSVNQVGAFIAPFAFGVARDNTGSYQAGLFSLPLLLLGALAVTVWLQVRVSRLAVT